MSGNLTMALFWGVGLMFWPIFQLIYRRWDSRAKRLLIVFLITLGVLTGYASLVIGPWKGHDVFALVLLLPVTNLASLIVSIFVCTSNSTISLPRTAKWIAITLTVLVCSLLIFTRFILDWQGQPVCHKVLMSVFENWMDDNHTNAFPNVRGVGRDSLTQIHQDYPVNLEERYGYVAGLRKDDPGDLVLAYVNQPTRWIWHGVPRTIFNEKRWIVIPVDFTVWGGRELTRPGECSETLSTDEFQERLKKTIDFVRTNQRPNWETVVAEQTKFLDFIKEK
jgi:hypothetical protein